MEKYIKKKGILVGTFTKDQLKKKIDKIEVDKAMEKYGLKYTNTEFVHKGGQIVGLRVYVCNLKDADFNC